MYTLDDRLADALALAWPTMVIRLSALEQDGSVRERFDLARQLLLSGSSVGAELRRDARRSASLVISNASGTLAPSRFTDTFAQGSRVSVEVGALVDGEPMYAPLMSGFVVSCRTAMRGATISLSAASYLSACAQETGEAILLSRGTALPDVLHTLFDPVLPGVEWVVSRSVEDRVIAVDVPVLQRDIRLDVGLRIARDLGCEVYDDRLGRIVVRLRPDPFTQDPVRTMTSPIDVSRDANRPPYNAQPVEVTIGEQEPFYVVEEITDPSSPIHRSRIGLRTAPTISSDLIPDPTTALRMARAWLAGRALSSDQVEGTELPRHLDLDEGDVVARDESTTGASGRFLIESITYPLGPGSIQTVESAVLPLFLTDVQT